MQYVYIKVTIYITSSKLRLPGSKKERHLLMSILHIVNQRIIYHCVNENCCKKPKHLFSELQYPSSFYAKMHSSAKKKYNFQVSNFIQSDISIIWKIGPQKLEKNIPYHTICFPKSSITILSTNAVKHVKMEESFYISKG